MPKRILLLLLPLLAVVLWLSWPGTPAPPATPTGVSGSAADPEVAATTVVVHEAEAAPGTAGERTSVGATDAAALLDAGESEGSLLVHVVWADGAPAPRVSVYLAARVPGVFPRILAALVTDAAGEARAEVQSGKVLVTSDRGGRVEVEIEADQEQDVRLELAAGLDVEGVVRDTAGAPVAGADIWLTSWQSAWCAGAFVATADASGAFALRAVPKDQSLGAVMPGYGPSPLVDLELCDSRQSPVRVELVLAETGGALTGRVVDVEGTGIAGAIVAVGSSKRLVDHRSSGTNEERWAPRRGVTDADGRYELSGLAPGSHPVEVWARAFPYWRGECTIEAAGTTPLDIPLLAGVTVHGLVTGEDGEPLEGAVVRAFPIAIVETFLQGGQYDYESTFGCPFAVADAGGRYRLACAAPGELHLYAGPGGRQRFAGAVPWANETLRGEPGDTLEWNPRIDPGPTIHGVVRYRDGVPMANVFVSVLEPGGKRRQSVVNDEDGRFRFVKLERKAYDVSVQVWSPPKDSPPVEAREVWPDARELEITAAFDSPTKQVKGSVRGRVSDAAGRLRNPDTLAVILALNHRSWTPMSNLKDGQFHFEGVEPGSVQLVVLDGEDPILFGPWFELQPAEHKDVGILVTEPGGKLLLDLVRQPGTEALEPVFYVTPIGAMHGRKLAAGKGVTDLAIDNLCVGEHRITAYCAGMARIRGTCTIAAGVATRATFELRAAALREIVVEYGAEQRVTHIRVQDRHGAEIFDFAGSRTLERPYRVKLQLPLGSFMFLVETESGGRAQREFEMTSLAADQPPIVLQAK